MVQAKAAPDLNIPPSEHTVTVSIIDTTGHVEVDCKYFMTPVIKGLEKLRACCYSFLIKHNNPNAKSKYDTMVFDLGIRKDFKNSPKAIIDSVTTRGLGVKVEKDVVQLLNEYGEDPSQVGGIIWSHWHWVRFCLLLAWNTMTEILAGPYW